MDTITQGLLGAAIAEAGFRGRLGPRAPLFGALCAVLPDADVVAGFAGEWANLVHHRGITHSLLVLPLVAPLLGWLGSRLFGLGLDLLQWIHLALWALVTHPLLDLFTAYGTQLLAPVSDQRFAVDGVSIIDPLYTIPLLIAVIARRRHVAFAALVVTTLYLGLGLTISRSALAAAQVDLTLRGVRPAAMRAVVPLAFPLLRRIVVRDVNGDIQVGTWSPFQERMRLVRLQRLRDPLVEAALATEEGRIFQWFADGYVHATLDRDLDGAVDVELSDQRYGLFVNPAVGPFRARFRFDPQRRFLYAEMLHRPEMDVGEELRAGWALMFGD